MCDHFLNAKFQNMQICDLLEFNYLEVGIKITKIQNIDLQKRAKIDVFSSFWGQFWGRGSRRDKIHRFLTQFWTQFWAQFVTAF